MAAPPRTPAAIAIERLAKMATAGSKPGRMAIAVDNILIEWGAEDMPPADLRERIEQLQSDIDDGVTAAEDYLAEADTDKARTAAQGQLDALAAVRARLAEVIDS